MDLKYIIEVLFPYVVILYLVDSLIYIKTFHLLFISELGRGYKLQKTGLRLAGLSPFCQYFISHYLHLYFTREGVYFVADKQNFERPVYKEEDFRFISFYDISNVLVESKDVKINEDVLIKTPSPLNAKYLEKLVREFILLKPAEREEKVNGLFSEATDLQRLKSIRAEHSKSFYLLKFLSTVLFALTFIVLPLTIYTALFSYLKLSHLLFLILAIYFILTTTAWHFHKRIYIDEIRQRIYLLLSIIFSPVTTMHVLNNLYKDLYVKFDYLTIAAMLLPPQEFKNIMKSELYRLAYAKDHCNNPGLNETWSSRESNLRALLVKAGVSIQEIWNSSGRKDKSAASYCPLCAAEYRKDFGMCDDCNIRLINYKK